MAKKEHACKVGPSANGRCIIAETMDACKMSYFSFFANPTSPPFFSFFSVNSLSSAKARSVTICKMRVWIGVGCIMYAVRGTSPLSLLSCDVKIDTYLPNCSRYKRFVR
jgi:hypothetical protein